MHTSMFYISYLQIVDTEILFSKFRMFVFSDNWYRYCVFSIFRFSQFPCFQWSRHRYCVFSLFGKHKSSKFRKYIISVSTPLKRRKYENSKMANLVVDLSENLKFRKSGYAYHDVSHCRIFRWSIPRLCAFSDFSYIRIFRPEIPKLYIREFSSFRIFIWSIPRLCIFEFSYFRAFLFWDQWYRDCIFANFRIFWFQYFRIFREVYSEAVFFHIFIFSVTQIQISQEMKQKLRTE